MDNDFNMKLIIFTAPGATAVVSMAAYYPGSAGSGEIVSSPEERKNEFTQPTMRLPSMAQKHTGRA